MSVKIEAALRIFEVRLKYRQCKPAID